MSASTIYTIGFLVLLGCGVYLAALLRVPETWIVIGGLAVNCLGMLWASSYPTAPVIPPKA